MANGWTTLVLHGSIAYFALILEHQKSHIETRMQCIFIEINKIKNME
jgi:hypothetical protein